MGKVQTSLGTLSYEIYGSGTPLVMLRGLGRTTSHWLGFEKKMAERFQVVVTDLRGIGASTRRHGIFDTVWNYADDLSLVLDHAGIDNAHVMGVSLGGMAALSTGIRYPNKTRSIILVNSSIGGQGIQRISFDAAKFLIKAGLNRQTEIHGNLVDLLVGDECSQERRKEISQAYRQIAENEGLFVKTVAKQLLAAIRFSPSKYLKKHNIPTLVIYGTDDRFVPFRNSQNLANVIPHAHLTEVRGAGHEISADKSNELKSVIEDWILRRESQHT